MVPHAPLLLLFATSAQTHIFPEIRIDAIRFLNLFLEYIPDATVSGWDEENEGHGSRIMKGYLGILNAGTRFGDNDGTKFYICRLEDPYSPVGQVLSQLHPPPVL